MLVSAVFLQLSSPRHDTHNKHETPARGDVGVCLRGEDTENVVVLYPLSTIVLPHKYREILPHLVHRLAVVPPLLGVPPLGVRVSELPLQWQGRSLGGVRVVAVLHGVHVGVTSREVLAGLLGVVGGLVGCGLANGSRGIGAREGGGEAGADGHLARDGCALRNAQGSEGGGHCVMGRGLESGESGTDTQCAPVVVAVAGTLELFELWSSNRPCLIGR